MTVSGWWCSRYWHEMRLPVRSADNKCYVGFEDFTRWVLTFLREQVRRGTGISIATKSLTTRRRPDSRAPCILPSADRIDSLAAYWLDPEISARSGFTKDAIPVSNYRARMAGSSPAMTRLVARDGGGHDAVGSVGRDAIGRSAITLPAPGGDACVPPTT